MATDQYSAETDQHSAENGGTGGGFLSIQADEVVTGQSLIKWIGRRFDGIRKGLGWAPSEQYERSLISAQIGIAPRLFLSAALGVGILVGLLWAVLGTAVAITRLSLFSTGPMPLIAAVLPLGLFGAGYWIGSKSIRSLPHLRARQRRRQIDEGLPDMVAFLYTNALSGMNILEMIESAASSEQEYGEIAVEFQRIQRRIETSQGDYRTAIEQVRQTTPSRDFEKFLKDLLGVLRRGGDLTSRLERETERLQTQARREERATNERLELSSEVYLTGKVFQLMLIIVLPIMIYAGAAQPVYLAALAYLFSPLIVIGYLVYIATETADDVGEGTMQLPDREIVKISRSIMDTSTEERYAERYPEVFGHLPANQRRYARREALQNPRTYLKQNPLSVLKVTLPVTFLFLLGMMSFGYAVPTVEAFLTEPFVQTMLWVVIPVAVSFVPAGVAFGLNDRARQRVRETVVSDLWTLAEANQDSQSLGEAFKAVGERGTSKFAEELGSIEAKRQYNIPIESSIADIANRYEWPQLTRTLKIIQQASKSDQHISDVIDTAADLTRTKLSIRRDRKETTGTQSAIIGASFFTMVLVVMILFTIFQPRVSALSGQELEQSPISLSVNTSLMSLLFLHMVIVDALGTGMTIGTVYGDDEGSVFWYSLIFLALGVTVWLVVPPVVEMAGLASPGA